MNYSLSDIPDKKERDKSLLLVQKLFTLLGKQIHRSNLYGGNNLWNDNFYCRNHSNSNLPCSSTLSTTLSYHSLIVAIIVGVFLVRYRSKKTRVNWKITLAETIAIVIIATVASLLLGAI